MRAMVVGAGGFLGSRLTRHLVQGRSEVHGTWFRRRDRLPEGPASDIHIGEIEAAKLPSPDAVFVCAAHIPYGALGTPSAELTEANVRLVERCLSWFPGARIVLASSAAAYGAAPSPRSESTTPAAPDAYGLSKLGGEMVVRNHPSFAIVRLTSLFGPGMTAPVFLRAIVNDARDRKRIRILGDGKRTQDYLFIDDAARLMSAAAASTTNGVFLGASGITVSNQRAARAVASEIPGTEIEFDGEDATPSTSYDPSWTFRQLRFSPAVDFEEGVGRMIRGC